MTLQTNGAQALVGSSIVVTAAVKGSGNSVPTGTVTLTSGSNSYGQEPLDGTGQAIFTLAALPVGQYALTASYDLHTPMLTATSRLVMEVCVLRKIEVCNRTSGPDAQNAVFKEFRLSRRSLSAQ